MQGLTAPRSHSGLTSGTDDDLFKSEQWWRDRYNDIYDRGYQLRPRYHPNWVPSWKALRRDFYDVEDGQPTIVSVLSLYYQC
jgi:hypothetical protein